MTMQTIGTTADEVLALVDELEEGLHAGHDLRTLALRGAALAMADGADPDLVTATLLHDIGRARYLSRSAPGVPHEEVGRRFMAERFSDHAAWLVAQHVAAQRYLATVDGDYTDGLTGPQQTALRNHGSTLSDQQVLSFESNEWAADAVRVRRWADRAVTEEPPLPAHSDLAATIDAAWQR